MRNSFESLKARAARVRLWDKLCPTGGGNRGMSIRSPDLRSPDLRAGGHVAKLGRREAGMSLEHSAEVALIGEAAHQRDFG
jgi:hypothetical protein